MRKAKIKEHLSVEEIQKRIKSSKQKSEFRRWQTIYLTKTKGLNAQEVGEIVGISPRTVNQLIYYYNKYGAEGLKIEGSGGRRRALLTWEEEEALLLGLTGDAAAGLLVIVKGVKQRAEAKLGYEVSKDYPYDLLHRHGWRKIAPRPQHPKSDAVKQEEFKKNSRKCWHPPYPAIRRKICDR